MSKKNLRPQQSAPVQRENTGTTTAENGLVPLCTCWCRPFAGDDAE
ncbi:MAG: anacyclamide/piricyclamide family prenylated cyclic peptide [Coleofasciculus sp. C2-GNP5-27]